MDDGPKPPNTQTMKIDLLVLSLLVAATTGCATANPRRVDVPPRAFAERAPPDEVDGPSRKRPPAPRWVAPPPAYGNRVVRLVEFEALPPEG